MIYENKKVIIKKPSREEVKKIFFKNIDMSRFSNFDFESSIKNIQNIITIWESAHEPN